MGRIGAVVRLATVGVGAALLAGCADVRLTQSPDEAIIRVGGYNDGNFHPIAKYIGHYAPYAVLAAKGYENLDPRGRPDGSTKFVDPQGRDRDAEARAWMTPWRFEFAEVGPLCAGPDKACGVPGLAFQVWSRREGRRCSEAAVVFRGTDANSLGDWLSNFHGVTRLLPVNDQYEQVQTHMDRIVRRMRTLPCIASSTRIVAVGHSLGGGLAQQAAYVSPAIHQVYAFDSSPVTGWFDQHTIYKDAPWPLAIDRVYEHGEVLAYLRFFIRQFIPGSACDPQIRTFRVDLIHGFPIFQHNMDELAAAFLDNAGRPYDPQHAQLLPGPAPSDAAACRAAHGGAPIVAAR
ncbi:MAG: DUF2974 domain-containing protein [Methylocystis sp.]|nr:DUF2974 domain-containing protein [Methylocystis sp.]MBI3275200.1 DUF2974 domain-containing protein [Methylocystis sp.]